MKNKVMRKDFLVEIKKTFGRFISIFFIVALGVAFYSGIRATEPDMRLSGDAFFDRTSLMDIRVMGTLGLTDADVQRIEQIDGVKNAEGTYSKDVLCPVNSTEKVIHIMASQDSFNEVQVSDGRMPDKEGECLLDEDFMEKSGYKIGDTITFRSGDAGELTDTLTGDTFKVVGAGSTPLYIAIGRGTSQIGNGEINGFAVVDTASFNMDVYSEIHIEVEGAKDAIVFTEEYDALIEAVKTELEAIETERCEARKAEIVAEVEEELSGFESELLEEEDKLLQAKETLAKAKSSVARELAAARLKLLEAEAEIKAAEKQIEEGKRQIEDAKAELTREQKNLNDKKAEYEAGVKELETKKTELLENEKKYQDAYDETMQLFADNEAMIAEKKAEILAKKDELLGFKAELDAQLDPLKVLQAEGKLAFHQEILLGVLLKQEEELLSGFDQIEAGLAQIASGEQELASQKAAFLQIAVDIENGKVQIADGEKQLEEAKLQLEDGQMQIDAAWKTIQQKEQELEDGIRKLNAGRLEYQKGKQEYQQGSNQAVVEFADGESQILEGERQLISARQDIAEAQAEIDKIENPKWYIQDRVESVVEYEGYGENADRMGAIGKVFPILFFLVAALISLTSMTRMVEEQRTQIGTLKALGYSRQTIAKKYIYYALLATLGGSIFGVLAGEKIFPFVIVVAYKILYIHIPDLVLPYNLEHGIVATVIALGCILFATMFACYKELLAQPASLMRPPAPKIGKKIFLERIGFIWKRLNFTWKSAIRNLVRYKKRFLMTVFGISGSMALMLVGFGLKDSIYDIGNIQYEEIQRYDAAAYADEEEFKENQKQIIAYLNEEKNVDAYMQSRMQKIKAKTDESTQSIYLVVPEEGADLTEFFEYRSRTSDDVYSLEEHEVIITEKVAKMLGVSVGDSIWLTDEEKGDKEVQIGAICENYMGHYLYLRESVYEELYGALPKYNCVMYKVPEGMDEAINQIGEELLKFDSILNVTYISSTVETLDGMLNTLSLVTVVLIISAGMLAFVVLYNLNTINIAERKRELATLKVLGFYDGEVSSYVFRENIILTFIGIGVGLILGNILHRFVVVTVEVNAAMFGREIHPTSYLQGALWTIAFSLLINWIMHAKLKKINMVESLKSVE